MASQKVVRLLFLLLLFSSALFGQTPEPTPAPVPGVPDTLRIGIVGAAPFVFKEGDIWQGLTIDVWEKVAATNSWRFVYVHFDNVQEAVKALQESKVDLIAGNVSIIAELSRQVEFSQPYFRAGLQIMITDERPHTVGRMIEDLNRFGHLSVLWYAIGIVFLLTVLVTLFERKHNPDFPKRWIDAFAEAFYYVISLSLGKSAYKGFGGWFGRLVMVFWLIMAVFIVTYASAALTSVMSNEIRSQISGPRDLIGRKVGAVKDTTATFYIQRHNLDGMPYDDLDGAVDALVHNKISAIIGSAPLLQYFDQNHPQLPITEIGPIFAPYNYGFALRRDSPIRAPLNSALLMLQESGTMSDIGTKYFGSVYQQ